MDKTMIVPVILAGGSGQRLWPLSRTAYPKQFLTLLGDKHSLFQATIQRLPTDPNFVKPLIICHEDYRFIIAEQLRQIAVEPSAIILEPSANNTAPAIALAAEWVLRHFADQNCVLLVLPADHYIADVAALQQSIHAAVAATTHGYLVTFGIPITKPETGYGYIKIGVPLDFDEQNNGNGINKVAQFIEKPDLNSAQQFMHDASYVWNSGMFMFAASNYLHELQQLQPDIVSAARDAITHATPDLDFVRPRADCYANCPAISIDYAVMEHTQYAAVLRLQSAWSDIGSWQAVWEYGVKDAQGNHIVGEVIAKNSSNCLISAQHRLVATLEVDNLAVIETADAVLVTHREQSQNVKDLVAALLQQQHSAASDHRQVQRPWGWFDSIAQAPGFQVKHIFVDPHKSLSLQLHKQRSEHWVIVKGNARVVRGTETFDLGANESTYIPMGVKHQLINLGSSPLELIEVQCGSYLGEDDIVRFADSHGRATVSEKEYIGE
jgi:mannose-1-phosphate guanylyltransferase/mannose-6-phosphate isomerase